MLCLQNKWKKQKQIITVANLERECVITKIKMTRIEEKTFLWYVVIVRHETKRACMTGTNGRHVIFIIFIIWYTCCNIQIIWYTCCNIQMPLYTTQINYLNSKAWAYTYYHLIFLLTLFQQNLNVNDKIVLGIVQKAIER